MAQLIDFALVILAVGASIWFTLRYFYNLGKTPKGGSVSCAGCNSGCHDDIPENPSLGLLRKNK